MPSNRDAATLAALAAALVWGGAAAGEEPGTPPAAQPVEASEPLPRFGEEIVVTGTRIPRKDLTTPAPVTVFSREEIQARGYATLGDFLQSLPEQGNALNRQVNNGFALGMDGGTFVSLRGLGSHRTLVLLNGRRMASLGPFADVDVSALPSAVVERVEILKDGASPIYGADAVAGVVNVITRKKFDGVEVSALTGRTTHGDGTTFDVSATGGIAGERGQVLLSASFFNAGDIMAGDRGFSRIPQFYSATGNVTDQNPQGVKGPFSVGSPVLPQASVAIPEGARGVEIPNPGGDPRIELYNQLMRAYPGASSLVRDPSSPLGWRPYRGVALPPLGDGYNYQPENYLVSPEQRIALFSTGAANLGASARAYFEGSYANRQSHQRLAPFPFFTLPSLVVSKDNPYNPFGIDLPDVNRRLMELSRRGDQNANSFRFVAGVDGTLPDAFGPARGWFWDASVTYSRMDSVSHFNRAVDVPKMAAALGPGFADPAAPGGYRCGTPDAPISGCVPLNLFGPPGSITPQQLEALSFTETTNLFHQMISAQLNARGELFRLLSDRPVALAFGYEYRSVSGSMVPDALSAAGEAGDKIPAARDSHFVNEGYAELSVPIVSQRPLLDDLEAMAAARAFKYSWLGADKTYKLGGRWRPVRDVTLRGTWSTAYRAPAGIERAMEQFQSLGVFHDPCGDLTGASPARIAACGAAGNNGNPDALATVRIGGNPALRPETAVTYTGGVVLEPRFAPGLSLTVDYWDVAIDQVITQVNPDAALASCYPTQPGVAPRFCDLVQRDPTTQALSTLTMPFANVGRELASGVDFAMRYGLPTVLGRFGLSLDATWLRRYDVIDPDGTVVHGKGTYDLARFFGGLGGVYPAWKLNAGLSWRRGRLGAAGAIRYIGSFEECGDTNGEPSYCFLDSSFRRRVDAYATADVSASYDLPSALGRTTIALGIQNVLDTPPAVIYSGFAQPSDPTAYDYTGRFVWLRLTHAL